MPKPNTVARLLCILVAALGAQSALANEREYISCSPNGESGYQTTRYILDEANSTASQNYEDPKAASFTEEKVVWGDKSGRGWSLNRKDLTLVSFLYSVPTTVQCEIIPPYDVGEKQKWTIRPLSLHCNMSGRGEGYSPTIELKGQMRLDVKYPRTKSRIVFNVTSKKGYRRIFCDGRQHKATDTTPFVLEGSARELTGNLWRVRINFDEIDFGSPIRAFREYKQGGLAQAHWPDKISQQTSNWLPLPTQYQLNREGYYVRRYAISKGKDQPELVFKIEFRRVE